MKGKIRKLLRLSPEERGWLLKAYGMMVVVNVGLRCLGFYRVFQLMSRNGGVGRKGSLVLMRETEVDRIWRVVDIARRNHFCRVQCLHRSLVVYWLLKSAGVGVSLCIGVQKEGGVLKAHAWVEHRGQMVGEPAYVQQVYAPLMRRDRLRGVTV